MKRNLIFNHDRDMPCVMPVPRFSQDDIWRLCHKCEWRDIDAAHVPPLDQMDEIDVTAIDDRKFGPVIVRVLRHPSKGFFGLAERAEDGRAVCSVVIEPGA
jgi:hypothetical protein